MTLNLKFFLPSKMQEIKPYFLSLIFLSKQTDAEAKLIA